MANYVIGDVQGCFDSLQALLNRIDFNPSRDTLWFAGDLVNRGPKSLESLRFIHSLGQAARTVLGNHDLHLLALACGLGKQHKSDTIAEVMQAPDGQTLIDWLRSQPLALALPHTNGQPALLVHAGILPQWGFEDTLAFSQEVSQALQADDWQHFMAQLYGNEPRLWNPALEGVDRLRILVNVFTRMRMIHDDTSLELKFKLGPDQAPTGLRPWFEHPRHNSTGLIVFGHWSTLNQLRNPAGFCLDTGCVWGGQLTALRLEDLQLFSVPASEPAVPSVP